MNRKKVWFINQYITSPKMCGKTHRHFSLAKYLHKNNDVVLFTGNYSHLHFNETEETIHKEENVTIVNLKLLKYKSNLLRILNFFHFVFKLRLFNYKKIGKPDIIVISTMSLFPTLLMKYYKRKFRNVKIVHEIRDIWPLTPVLLGGYSKRHPFIKLLEYCEKTGYKNADHFVGNLENANKHIFSIVPERKNIPFTWVSNGYDELEFFKELSGEISEKIPKDKLLVGYAGAIGIANCMEVVIKAFNEINNDNLHLCLVGAGDNEAYLRKIAKGNVTFLGSIPKNEVNSFLKKMDICILSWKKTPLYNFGISPNKLFDYLYASKPVIMCGDIENTIIHQSKCGWVVPAENKDALVSKLNEVEKIDTNILLEFGERGKKYFENRFLYRQLAEKYQKEVIDVL